MAVAEDVGGDPDRVAHDALGGVATGVDGRLRVLDDDARGVALGVGYRHGGGSIRLNTCQTSRDRSPVFQRRPAAPDIAARRPPGTGRVRVGGLARRRRPDVVADAPARPARPPSLALQGRVRVRRLARAAGRAARAGVEGRGARLPRARGLLGRGLGALRPARRGRRPGALRPRVGGAAVVRGGARRAHHRRRPDLRRAGQRRPSRAPRAVPGRRRGGYAAGRLHRQGPAVGQPALRLAGDAAARLPLVGRTGCGARSTSSTSRASTTSAASSPTGRCRRGPSTR